MSPRGRRPAAVLAALLPLLACDVSTSAPLAPRLGGVEEHLGALLPLDTEFQDTNGRGLRLGEIVGQGQPLLLVLGYSRCSMLCSLVLQATADLVPQLGLAPGKDYRLLSISIDPRETPLEAGRRRGLAVGRAGLADAQAWPFLVGKEADIRRVADSLGFSYRWDAASEQYAHPAVIFSVSAAGRVSGYFYELKPDAAAVRAALLGETSAVRRVAAAVLECVRFDALARKYGGLVQRCFQAGALAVALALALTVAGLFRRERRTREAGP